MIASSFSTIRSEAAKFPDRRERPPSTFHRLETILLAGYAVFLVYLSLVPFDFTWTPPAVHGRRWILGLHALPISPRDVLCNIAFYFPIGIISFHLLRQRERSRAASALGSALGALGLSLAIEYSQRWFPSRVPSWVDVSSNLIGAISGIGLAWFGERSLREIGGRIRQGASRRWWWFAANAFALLVLAVQLRPYDLVVDPRHAAAAALRHGRPQPLAKWNDLPLLARAHHPQDEVGMEAELDRLHWEYVLDRLVDIGLYAGVAMLFVVGLHRKGKNALMIWLLTGISTIGLATLITGLRVFLISQGLDTAHWICGVIGWLIGCCVGWTWIARNAAGPNVRIEPPSFARQKMLALSCMAFVVLYEMAPFEFKKMDLLDFSQMQDICLVPFAAHVRCRLNQALYDLSGDFLRYAIFGASLLTLLGDHQNKSSRHRPTICVMASVTACTVMESLHLWMPNRFTDVTTVIMAAFGSYAGVMGLIRIGDLYRSLMTVVVEDPLTSQLVEGATYTPLPVTPENRPHAGTSLKGPARFDPPR